MSVSRVRPGVALVAALIAAACGGQEPEQGRLRMAVVTNRDIVVSAVAAGVVEPIMTVDVKSKASGEIIEVLVEEGDRVRRNQLLVRVDPRIPQNAVVQAEADSVVARAELDNAEAQFSRAEAMHRSEVITDLEFETARLARASASAALIRARRALEDAKISFEDTEVRAPSDGVVLQRAVEVGSVIASASRDMGGGAVLLRMADLDTVQVRALVDETDIGMVRPGQSVTIRVAAYPNRPFSGDVLRIGAEAVVQQSVTMFPVLIRIANRDGALRPGMNAEVEVHIGDLQNALAVPNAALRAREDLHLAALPLGISESDLAVPATGGEYIVFVLRNGVPTPVPVETGLTDFDHTAVLAGLSEGDSVFILPTTGLLEEQQRREEFIRERVGGPLGRTQ